VVQTAPEIQRTSLVSATLYLKSLPLNIDVLGFDYLDSPAVSAAAGNSVVEFCLPSMRLCFAINASPLHRHDDRCTLPRADCHIVSWATHAQAESLADASCTC